MIQTEAATKVEERSKTIERGISMTANTVTANTRESHEVLSLFSE